MSNALLQRIVTELNAAMQLSGDTLADAVRNALRRAVAAGDWLAPQFRAARAEGYARHLLHADPDARYALLAIAWSPGQHSPVHAHYCWCGVGVYAGELEETYYRETGSGPVELERVRRSPGDVSFDRPLSGIHRIENCSRETAVSLHVYGVSKDHIATGVNRIVALRDGQSLLRAETPY